MNRDNKAERRLGKQWELAFCDLAQSYGLAYTEMQIGREGPATWKDKAGKVRTAPDITVWSSPGEHHEIKHKNPTRGGEYGFECHRFQALVEFRKEVKQSVFYTIHDWERSGAKSADEAWPNLIGDWVTVEIGQLIGKGREGETDSWVDGVMEKGVPIYYWPTWYWGSLAKVWGLPGDADEPEWQPRPRARAVVVVPRCVTCHAAMSIVRISDVCGRCQTDDLRASGYLPGPRKPA